MPMTRYLLGVGPLVESEDALRLASSPERGRQQKDVKKWKWRRVVTVGHQAMSETVRMA